MVDGGWWGFGVGRILIRALGFCVAGFMVNFLIFDLGGSGQLMQRWPILGLRRRLYPQRSAGVLRDWVHHPILDFSAGRPGALG